MITWAYIAGFFDGDGCLSSSAEPHGARNFARAQFTQSGPLGTELLTEIMGFLALQGIDSTVITKQRLINHRLISNDLVLRQRESVAGLIAGMLPWLRVKKDLAQDYQRHFVLYPRRSGKEQSRACVVHNAALDSESHFWAYVSGFFDAEGCVTRHQTYSKGHACVLGRVSMSQAGEAGARLFPRLKEDLASHGVKSSVMFARAARRNEQCQYRLDVTNREDATRFMRNTMPFLCMKKVVVQDHLRYFTIFPKWNMPPNGVFVPNWTLLGDRRSGMRLKDIAAKRGIAMENVSKRLRAIEKENWSKDQHRGVAVQVGNS